MLRNAAVVIAVGAVIGGLAACGSSPPPKPQAAALTCNTTFKNGDSVTADIVTLVQDQKSQNASLTQNWVETLSGSLTNQGQDLQAAADDFGGRFRHSQLAADAAKFSNDADTFLSDESGGLIPGWTGPYDAVEADINKLAADCGMPGAGSSNG